MSGAESDFEPIPDSPESPFDDGLERKSRRSSVAPTSGLKRRRRSRSSSADSEPLEITRDVQGQYNDEYRMLYNETVNNAAARFSTEHWPHRGETQIGLSIWSLEEKTKFFAALEMLGKDDIPGIAKAVGTKSIPQVREYAILLDDSAAKQRDTKVTLRDIPAAAEISTECNGHLDTAGDALAWYQEQFEAKREQDRYGDHWLITPEIGEDIEAAHAPSRRSSFASSPPPGLGDGRLPETPKEPPVKPQILQDVPEGDLLNPAALLKLSSTVFMNGSDTQPSWYPHWSTLVSPLASKPSMYRTALVDFHALVVSLAKRLTQASIIQATSRIRAQGWRTKKGVNPLIKKRDVFTAIDMLRLPRDGRERWKKVARRCGLRVYEGAGKNKREVDWKEVEQLLGLMEKSQDPLPTDEETQGFTSGLDDENFKARAIRSGTPLPSQIIVHPESDHDDEEEEEEEEHGNEDVDYSDVDDSDMSELIETNERPKTSDELEEMELRVLEKMDGQVNREEELRLVRLLGIDSHSTDLLRDRSVEIKAEEEELQTERTRIKVPGEPDWRAWTDYCAEWEELPTPVPAATFDANQKSPSPAPVHSTALDVETGLSSSGEGPREERKRKRRKVAGTELPVRGARAYAALQELERPLSVSEGPQSGTEYSADDDAKRPAPSIEEPVNEELPRASSHSDDMDWDWNSAL